MGVFLLLITLVLLFFGVRARCGKEKRLYVALFALAAALAFAAGVFAESDHVGASLSGMLSIFMR